MSYAKPLQVLQLPPMKASVALPVLADLVSLRELNADWLPEPSARRRGISNVGCLTVTELRGNGPVPIEAFPGVRGLGPASDL